MEYKCKTVSADKLIATPMGFVMPICQECKTGDCENPIEMRKVSIVGIKKDVKVFVRGNQFSFVINCNGYTK
jgi:hypothetical protein